MLGYRFFCVCASGCLRLCMCVFAGLFVEADASACFFICLFVFKWVCAFGYVYVFVCVSEHLHYIQLCQQISFFRYPSSCAQWIYTHTRSLIRVHVCVVSLLFTCEFLPFQFSRGFSEMENNGGLCPPPSLPFPRSNMATS